MRWITPFFLIAVILTLSVYPCARAVLAKTGGDEQTYYATTVDAIIANCEIKCCLKESRSNHLRRCAKTAEQKAHFLRRNKDRLIEGMMAEQLPLKRYKVERYVNARFHRHIELNP